MAENYLKLGKRDVGMEIMETIHKRLNQEQYYYNSLKPTSLSEFVRLGRRNEALLGEIKECLNSTKERRCSN